MNRLFAMFALCFAALYAQGCSRSGLGLDEPGSGGQSGQASGGTISMGGGGGGGIAGAGGTTGLAGVGGVHGGTGGAMATGGNEPGTGGKSGAAGSSGGAAGKQGGGGGIGTGGTGGSGATAGAGGVRGTGGVTGTGGTTTCPVVMCPAIACLNGSMPNPDPCGCPICIPPDAGVGKDAGVDACLQLPCPAPRCPAGTEIYSHPCGCPTCVPVDAGADTMPSACASMDECTCMAASSCQPIAESCYCPAPKCSSGACVCGGGRYVGCAPAGLATCPAAQARVATLCPQFATSTIFKGLCDRKQPECITKCLDDVTSCGDLSCSMCEACDCLGDKFSACVSACQNTLASQ